MKKWYFDHYPIHRKADSPKSWVQLSDTEEGQSLEVYVGGEKKLTFSGDLDQWGTWIGIAVEKDFTVAQEWSTKSFIQALLAGLHEFSKICDFEDNLDKQKPEYVEETDPSG
jgi:hypothetical protein